MQYSWDKWDMIHTKMEEMYQEKAKEQIRKCNGRLGGCKDMPWHLLQSCSLIEKNVQWNPPSNSTHENANNMSVLWLHPLSECDWLCNWSLPWKCLIHVVLCCNPCPPYHSIQWQLPTRFITVVLKYSIFHKQNCKKRIMLNNISVFQPAI